MDQKGAMAQSRELQSLAGTSVTYHTSSKVDVFCFVFPFSFSFSFR